MAHSESGPDQLFHTINTSPIHDVNDHLHFDSDVFSLTVCTVQNSVYLFRNRLRPEDNEPKDQVAQPSEE